MTRFTLDLATRTCKVEQLDDCSASSRARRRVGLGYRHGFALGTLPRAQSTVPLQRDPALLPREGNAARPRAGARRQRAKPCSCRAAQRGEGFLVFPVYRWAEDRSDVVILDAQNVERAPLATIRLPHRLPLGFHGNYADGVTLS
jgi:carotenoid cleavage dioxygenase